MLRKIFKYAIFSIIPVAVLFLALEFAVRAFFYVKLGGHGYRVNRFVELEYNGPYYGEGSGKLANEMGFSGKGRLDPKKGRNEFRILALGGSGTAGTRNCSWPAILEAELNRRDTGRTVRVINGGIGGHASSGEKKWLTRWIKYKPDLVIIYDGWNDMYYSRYLPEDYKNDFEVSNQYVYPAPGERMENFLKERSILVRKIAFLADDLRRKLKEGREKRKNASAEGIVAPVYLNKPEQKEAAKPAEVKKEKIEKPKEEDEFKYVDAKPFKAKFAWISGEKVKTIDLATPLEDNMSGIYRTNLKEMVELAGKNGAKVILIVQPDLLYRYTHEPALFAGDDMTPVLGWHEGLRKDWIRTVDLLYPKVYRIMVETALGRRNVVGVYGIDSIFDKYPRKMSYWHNDSCHHNEIGRMVVGRHIADIVCREALCGK